MKYLFLFVISYTLYSIIKTDSNYQFCSPHFWVQCVYRRNITRGPFVMRFANISLCKGPKRYDCSVNTFSLYKDQNNASHLNMTYTVVKDCLLTQVVSMSLVKMQASSTQPSGEKNYLTYNMQKPCQHFFMAPTFRIMFNITDKCVVKKGIYHTQMDPTDIARGFFGSQFFYGNYLFKSSAMSSTDNFSCAKATLIFEKIP